MAHVGKVARIAVLIGAVVAAALLLAVEYNAHSLLLRAAAGNRVVKVIGRRDTEFSWGWLNGGQMSLDTSPARGGAPRSFIVDAATGRRRRLPCAGDTSYRPGADEIWVEGFDKYAILDVEGNQKGELPVPTDAQGSALAAGPLHWSPDGKKAFQQFDQSPSHVFTLSEIKVKTIPYGAVVGMPWWAPDSSKYATLRMDSPPGQADAYLLVEGRGPGHQQPSSTWLRKRLPCPELLTLQGGGNIWFPDSKRLLTAERQGHTVVLKITDLDGSSQELSRIDADGVSAATVSPDGSAVAMFLRYEHDRACEVVSVSVQTRVPTVLATTGERVEKLQWSRDGKLLAAQTCRAPRMLSLDELNKLGDVYMRKALYVIDGQGR